MAINKRGLALWGFYIAFSVVAIVHYWQDSTLQFTGPLGGIKLLVWLMLAGFLAYSVFCSSREDLFRTVGTISKLHWGRQIGIDLYLGLFVGILIIFLHEGPMVALLWLIPTLAFANLSMLLYIALNFDGIAGKLLGS